MLIPALYEQGAQQITAALLAIEIVGLATGAFLTFKAHSRAPGEINEHQVGARLR